MSLMLKPFFQSPVTSLQTARLTKPLLRNKYQTKENSQTISQPGGTGNLSEQREAFQTNRRLLLAFPNWPTSATNLPEQACVGHQSEAGLQVFHH